MNIRYVTMEEKKKCRLLWKEAFPEDSKEFMDYYFTEKTKSNRVLVLEIEEEIATMLHQNPYRMYARGRIWSVDYMVGAATGVNQRHKGYLRQLLHHTMNEMWAEQVPFSFLMPADPAIYTPFGYTYIYDQPSWELLPEMELMAESVNQKELGSLADWINTWLQHRYEGYLLRDGAYLKCLIKELESEAGCLETLSDHGSMVGVRGTWGLEKPTQRLLYCDPGYVREKEPPKPAIMARIICAREFVKVIHLSPQEEKEEIVIGLNLQDPIIEDNNQRFLWHMNHETSWLEPLGETAKERGLTLSIEDLTRWLFGYNVPEAAKIYADLIEPLNGVFIDEVV